MNLKALNLLGIARRAGVLMIGQDQVFGKASKIKLFIVVTEDCGPAVLRKISNFEHSGRHVCCTISGVSKEELGRSMGVSSAQIAALPAESGFAHKLAELLRQGGGCTDE